MLKGKKVLGGRAGGMPEMVFEYILKQHNIDPTEDLSIDQSIDFGSTASSIFRRTGGFHGRIRASCNCLGAKR